MPRSQTSWRSWGNIASARPTNLPRAPVGIRDMCGQKAADGKLEIIRKTGTKLLYMAETRAGGDTTTPWFLPFLTVFMFLSHNFPYFIPLPARNWRGHPRSVNFFLTFSGKFVFLTGSSGSAWQTSTTLRCARGGYLPLLVIFTQMAELVISGREMSESEY